MKKSCRFSPNKKKLKKEMKIIFQNYKENKKKKRYTLHENSDIFINDKVYTFSC